MTENSSQQIKQPLLGQKQKASEKPLKLESFFALFRYANSTDKIQIFLGTICALGVGTSFPFFMIFFGDILAVFVDQAREKAAANAFDVTIKFVIIGGITWFLSFIGLYCWQQSGSNQSLRFKKLYYKTLLEQQVGWYDSNDVNKLATEVASNISHIQAAIGQKCFMFVSTLTMSLFGFVYAYIKCWQLSLVLTGVVPFMMVAGVLMMKALANAAVISKTSYETAAARAEQAFGGIKTIKSLVGQSFEQQIFVKSLDEGKKKNVPTLFASSLSLAFVMLIFLSIYSLGFWYGKQLIIWHDYNAGVITGTFFCFIIGGSSIGQLSPIGKNFAEGKVAITKLYDLIKRKKTLVEEVKDGKKIKTFKSIEFKNVNFSYRKVNLTSEDQVEVNAIKTEQTLVLNNINLKIQPNKVNALVGQSGSGKSTISQLLMRYYDPINGSVTINGTNLTQVDLQKFRTKIGYVGQEPVLFAMSIQDNLKLANPKLTSQEIIEILKKANAWEFVEKLESGINTYVGASGAQLSGGQKQRIAIARAIAKNPQILILDEATSALDRKNEREIQITLKNLTANNITTLVIAHRLSTIQDADKITVLSKGKIIEQGNHKQLIDRNGLYYTLVKSQIGAQQKQVQKLQQRRDQLVNNPLEKITQIKDQAKGQIPKQKLDAVFSKLLKLGSRHNMFLILGALFAMANGSIWPLFNVAFSNLLALMINAKNKEPEINQYCLLFLYVAAGGALTTFFYKFLFDMYGQKLVYDVRKTVFRKLLRLPVAFYDKKENTPGAISTKLTTDAYQLNNMISGVCAVMFMNLSTVSISLYFAFSNSWQLTLVVLGMSPLIMISGLLNMKMLKGLTSKTQQTQKFIGSLISDTVSNIRTVKSFGSTSVFLSKFSQKLTSLQQLNNQKALKSSFLDGMGRGMIMIVQGLMFFIAGYFYQDGFIQNDNSVYIAIFSIIFAAMGVGQNSAFMPDMAKAKVAGASIFDIIEAKDQSTIIQLNGGGKIKCTAQDIQGAIQFKNVTFKYPQRDAKVLQNFSYKIQPHTKIAFVGPSGSGKSTITQILQRFYPLQSGSIQINGKDINMYQLSSYRNQIGYVSQQPTLLTGSVKQNICYDKKYSPQVIEKYTTISHSKGFIQQWSQKYDKPVGNKGIEISGGQKQRIALTRTLIRHPNLYVFDQSTSALDPDTQRIVFQNLQPLLQNKTTISIAHRLATIENSDKIIVMREGKIIEDGTYPQLMEKKDHFYRLKTGQ